MCKSLLGAAIGWWATVAGAAAESPSPLASNRFIEVARSDVGGHFFSQVICAPPAEGLVSWGTQTYHHKIRAHETRHFLIHENRWIDAFDVVKQQWQMRRPTQSPWPRSCHALAYPDGSGVVLLAGGRVVADHRRQRALSEQVWAYDAGADAWTPVAADPPAIEGHEWYSMENIPGTDEVLLVVTSQYDHRQVTYRFRYDPAAPPASPVRVGCQAPASDVTVGRRAPAGSAKRTEIEGVPPGTVAFPRQRSARSAPTAFPATPCQVEKCTAQPIRPHGDQA